MTDGPAAGERQKRRGTCSCRSRGVLSLHRKRGPRAGRAAALPAAARAPSGEAGTARFCGPARARFTAFLSMFCV